MVGHRHSATLTPKAMTPEAEMEAGPNPWNSVLRAR
jgi:hypothetical protein